MPVSSAALAHASDLADFVAASPSSYHAAEEVARRLEEAGFTRLEEIDAWPSQPGGRFVVVRDGAAIGWIVPPDAEAMTPVHVLGAHTDSPGFKLKPKPSTGSHGWLQAAVEVYGGPLLNSWLDRELRLAGRLALADGRVVLAATGPLLRLPQLAIHLDRGVNDGLSLDKQTGTQPVWGLGDAASADILGELAAA
ncbi:MAG: M18 family aminopeptidase, partial [Microbacterium sp.]